MGTDHIGDLNCERIRILNLVQFNDKALELVVAVRVFMANFMIAMIIVMVVVVIMMVVMHLMAQFQITLSADTLTKQNINRQRAHRRSHNLNTFAGFGFQRRAQFVRFAVRQQICLVDDDHIRASNLVFKQLRQRRFVVQILILLALGIHGGDVVGKLPVRHSLAIHDRNYPVDRHAG